MMMTYLMLFRPELRDLYPSNWDAISQRIRCVQCGAVNYKPHPETGSRVVLTTAHLSHDPSDNRDENLKALCQACHNRYDAAKRVANRKVYQRWDQEKAGQLPMDGIV